MRRGIFYVTAVCLILCSGFIGCKQKAPESQEAVEVSKEYEEMQPEAEALVEEAEKIGEQVQTEAKEMIEEAKEAVVEKAKEVAVEKAKEAVVEKAKETIEGAMEAGPGDVSLFQKVINKSKDYATVAEQAKYLIGTANGYLNSENFDMAIKIAQYVLQNLDANSLEAKDILEKATAGLKSAAKGAAEGVMKDVQKKMGDFGGFGK